MLTYTDDPTIRNAIIKRLDTERGIKVCEIKIVPKERETPPYIGVRVQVLIDDTIQMKSRFDLPGEFDYKHLHNEIDECAEQYKKARIEYWLNGCQIPGEKQVLGTGIRGRWAQHG